MRLDRLFGGFAFAASAALLAAQAFALQDPGDIHEDQKCVPGPLVTCGFDPVPCAVGPNACDGAACSYCPMVLNHESKQCIDAKGFTCVQAAEACTMKRIGLCVRQPDGSFSCTTMPSSTDGCGTVMSCH